MFFFVRSLLCPFIQTFVEGLLRLANVLEATNGTLKNVNNICTLAINSTKYLNCFPVTLLVYDDECYICLQHLQRLSPQE
jgi:sulfur relay (sulfurtransferase) DsrF/TusC family protein